MKFLGQELRIGRPKNYLEANGLNSLGQHMGDGKDFQINQSIRKTTMPCVFGVSRILVLSGIATFE